MASPRLLRWRRLAWAVAAAWALAACTDVPAEDVEPDTSSPLAFTIDVPPIALAGGAERTVCFYTTVAVPPEVAITRWESEVSSSAHGVQVFATPAALAPDGTLGDTCAYQDDAHRGLPRLLYSANLGRDASGMPAGTAMRMAATQPLVIRIHLVNAGDEPRTITAQVRARATLPGAAFIPSATFVSYRSDLRIAPYGDLQLSGACPLPAGLAVYRLSTLTLGHTTGTEVRDGSGLLFRGFDSAHPGESAWVAEPHVVEGALRYECRYLNRTSTAVTVGGLEGRDELCMVMGQVAPATADVTCVDDALVP